MVAQVVDGRQRGPDPSVVHDDTVTHRRIEVHSDERALSLE
jgi:hypothetical protein